MSTKETPNSAQHGTTSDSLRVEVGSAEIIDRDEEEQAPAVPAAAAAAAAPSSDEQVSSIKFRDEAITSSVLDEWGQSTSIHGMYYVTHQARFRVWKRRVWLILFLASASVLIWQIDILITSYRAYATNTNTQIKVPLSLPYPSVTVCNANTMQLSKVNETGIAVDENGWPLVKNEEELLSISQSLENFIQGTTFNLLPVDVTESWKPVITSVGQCFEFNTDEQVFYPGLEGGLGISLHINSKDYAFNNGIIGVEIYITQKGATEINQIPFEMAPPGAYQFIRVQRTSIQRERDKPWSGCQGDAPEYTQPKCRANCFKQAVRTYCYCREYDDPIQADILDYCADYGECYRALAQAAHDDPTADGACESQCSHPPCTETVYDTRSSLMQIAPLVDMTGTVVENLQDYVNLTINYEALRENQVTETKAQTFSQLLSNIGGQMGLFLGISVISLIELCGELLILRLIPRLWGDKRLYGIGSKDQ